jgi:dTDP-4-dehydrorhamnose reductase
MDLSRQDSVDAVFKEHQPKIVVHCAAIGSVDYCEKHYDEARDINVRGVRRMLNASERYGAKFVFISTNAVFSGTGAPYCEEDERLPMNVYGMLKKDAENMVMDYPHSWLIVRPIMLYGVPNAGGRGNWATRVADVLANGRMLYVVDDIVTQPTYAADLARVLWELIPHADGVYHAASPETMTLYDFAMRVACMWTTSKVNVSDRILPTSSEKFKAMAARPANTTYDLSKLRSFLEKAKQPMPCGVDDGLQRMFGEL